MENWLTTLPNWIMATMLGYNIIIIKKLIEKTLDTVKHNTQRVDLHDRAISETQKIPFDTSAIAKGLQSFPMFQKVRRDS